MGSDCIKTYLQDNWAHIRQYGVQTLAIFGSVARDEANEYSDVDLLVTFVGKVTFDRYMDLKFYLEDNLGVKVDLVTENSLREPYKSAILSEAIYVP
jgi:predicted nucleotidyltransferase